MTIRHSRSTFEHTIKNLHTSSIFLYEKGIAKYSSFSNKITLRYSLPISIRLREWYLGLNYLTEHCIQISIHAISILIHSSMHVMSNRVYCIRILTKEYAIPLSPWKLSSFSGSWQWNDSRVVENPVIYKTTPTYCAIYLMTTGVWKSEETINSSWGFIIISAPFLPTYQQISFSSLEPGWVLLTTGMTFPLWIKTSKSWMQNSKNKTNNIVS